MKTKICSERIRCNFEVRSALRLDESDQKAICRCPHGQLSSGYGKAGEERGVSSYWAEAERFEALTL
jgi:hypothetical protein